MSGHGRREAAWQLNAILWHDRVYADVHGEQGSSGAMPMIPPIGRAMSSPPWPAHEYFAHPLNWVPFASLTTQPGKGNWLAQAVVSIGLENLKALLLEARNRSRQIYRVH